MNERDFSKDVKVNKLKLDQESEEYSEVYYYYASESVTLKNKLNVEEDKLKLLESGIDLEFRRMERLPGGIKVTENSIEAFVRTDPRIKNQKDLINKIRESYNILETCVKAMEKKYGMINNLIDLYVHNYFHNPKGSSSISSKEDDLRKSLNKRRTNEDQ